MSLRWRLTLWHAALLGIVLAGFAGLIYVFVARQLANELDHTIHLRALDADRAVHSPVGGWVGRPPGRFDLATSPDLSGTPLYVQLVATDGRVLATSADLPGPLPALPPGYDGRDEHASVATAGGTLDVHTAPVRVDDRIVGVLQVAAALRPIEEQLARLRLLLAAIVLGAIALSGGVGWFLAGRAMRPVGELTTAAQSIGRSTNLSRRLPAPPGRDELGRLAATFNEMLGALEAAAATQQRFVADASHELRTPLATIRTNAASLLRSDGGGGTPAEREEVLLSIARESERMGRLVADLLLLARADAGQGLEMRPLALDALLLDVYGQCRGLAAGVRFEVEELEQVEVDGDPDRLKQLLLNLVDNALRHTPAGGTVALVLVRQGASAVLRVRDSGVGIAPEHLPRLFERFYRADQPRSRGAGGTGLGLAICRWVAQAHGGWIDVESAPGRGSVFSVSLPARAGGPPARAEPVLTSI